MGPPNQELSQAVTCLSQICHIHHLLGIVVVHALVAGHDVAEVEEAAQPLAAHSDTDDEEVTGEAVTRSSKAWRLPVKLG